MAGRKSADPNATDESIRIPNNYERSMPYHTWYANYDEIASSFQTGDLLLQHGLIPESQIIQLVFNDYWTHVAIVVKPSDIGLQIEGDPWCYWESNDILTCDDVILKEPKSGATLVRLEERLRSNLKTGYDAQFLVRHLEVNRTPEMYKALAGYIEGVHSWGFPSAQTGLAIYTQGRVLNRDIHCQLDEKGQPIQPLELCMVCSQLTAASYQAMGLLSKHEVPGAFAPGDFLSGSGLALLSRAHLMDEILIDPESLE